MKVLKYFQFLGKAGLQNFEKKEEFQVRVGFGKIKSSSRPKPRRGFFDFSDEPPTPDPHSLTIICSDEECGIFKIEVNLCVDHSR